MAEKEHKDWAETQNKMKATIIIQNKNYAQYLRKTILSCIIQDFPKEQYEIIGYDANSDDKSMDVYNEFKDRIKIVEVGDKTQSQALNHILKKYAKGKYISIINSDDWLLPHFIKIHANTLDEAPENVVMAYSNAYQEMGNGTREVYEPKEDKKLIPKEKIFERNFVFQPSVMLKRSALDKIGLFDEKLVHAWDYKAWIELAKIGSWAYIDSVTTVYRLHQQMGSVTKRDGLIRDSVRIVKEHFKIPLKGKVAKKDKEKIIKHLKKNFNFTDEEAERCLE